MTPPARKSSSENHFELLDFYLPSKVGPVGCGKTTVFNLLLNELEVKSGTIPRFLSFGYAAQEPWIITGTVRENILMGRKYDEKRYSEVIQAACLLKDLEMLKNGDKSYIGDRGITLR